MSKTTLRLIIILIVLWGAAYIYKGPMQKKVSDQNKPENFLANVDANALNKVVIVRNSATTTLIKEGDKFRIDGTKAFFIDKETAQQIADSIQNAKEATFDIASTDEKKKEEFGTDKVGIKVSLEQSGKGPVDLIIGKLADNFVDTYVSLASGTETYSIGENLVKVFDKEDWYDKTLFNSDASKVTKIRFQYKNDQYVLEKTKDVWKGVKPSAFTANQEQLIDAITTMTSLKATKIPAQTFKGTGLEKNSIIVQINGEGIDSTLMVGDEYKADAANKDAEKLYYAKKGDNDNIYLISETSVKTLQKSLKDLKL
ncbi:MAG: DUF4340 domain-containing protein [Candidatus Falkowbacteria bacterium]|nr:DUF4340 domain-containing protein [Candidatus Falkowbacteria bacterium]